MKRIVRAVYVAGFMLVLLLAGALAQTPQPQPSAGTLKGLNDDIERLAKDVLPAVVHVEVASYEPQGEDDDENIGNQVLSKERASGSGVIIDPNGYIVTANHVIERSRRIRVELDSRAVAKASAGQSSDHTSKSFTAKVVGTFKEADIAILKIEASNLPTLSFSDTELRQGQLVAAMGSPEGLKNSLSVGVVGFVSRQIEPDDYMEYIQTDAAIAPGSSGGPLVDLQNGRMVGINIFSLVQKGVREGLGFAVPSAMVQFVYEQVRLRGHVQKVDLGLDIQGVTPVLGSALRLPENAGVIVSGVTPDGASDKAGVREGDVLLSIDGKHLHNVPELNWALLHKAPGQHAKFEIARESTITSVNISLVEAPTDSEATFTPIDIETNVVNKLGVVVAMKKRATTAAAPKASSSGVFVTARLRGSSSQPELSTGDVICSINGAPITSVAQLRERLDSFKPGDAVALLIERKGKPMYVAFEVD